MFAYCCNNPIKYYDPTGAFSEILYSFAGFAIAEPTPIGEVVLIFGFAVVGGCWLYEQIEKADDVVDNKGTEAPKSITKPKDTPKEIDDSADSLPQQGKVSAVPDAPPVDAGNQGKHVIGHKNNTDPRRSTWERGENGVRQTQEAWKNSKQIAPNVRIGPSKDGRRIKIHFGNKGLHGYPSP